MAFTNIITKSSNEHNVLMQKSLQRFLPIIPTSSNNLESKNNDALLEINTNHGSKLANELLSVCKQHQHEPRWILLIDPQKDDIDALNKETKINQQKLLRINSTKVTLTSQNIIKTLANGNCSVIVLCGNKFNAKQIATFKAQAKYSRTECIVINNSMALH